jgi:hypothetical protein
LEEQKVHMASLTGFPDDERRFEFENGTIMSIAR